MARIACLLAEDFEDSEYRVPVERLRAAGHRVEVIGARPGHELRGKRGQVTALADAGIDDVVPERYDALFIPGGYAPDRLRADGRFVEFVRAFDALERPLAAICHGPQLLLTAHLVAGRKLTAWPTIQGDLRFAGAHVLDAEVVVDRHWITSRRPEDLPAFCERLLEELDRAQARTELIEPAPI